jgi:cobalt-zinc-cadmium efflux system outer membrane protein
MNLTFGAQHRRFLAAVGVASVFASASAAAQAPPSSQVTVTLDQAITMALQHNHAMLAARSTILQSQADEITANLRPNPVLAGDSQFLPLFSPGDFTGDYFNNTTQFDLGVGYLFERGGKRQHRLQAARDLTAVTTAQVADSERTLTFDVATEFIAALLAQSNVDFAQQDLTSFQQTVNISQASFNAGSMSQGDLLKIQLQLLQFQMDVSSAQLARVQALASLRQLLGYESVPENYAVAGDLQHQAVSVSEDDLETLALRDRPDLRAARLGLTAAQSQHALAQVNGKRDLGLQFSYSHVAAMSTGSLFANIDIPLFDHNQGEIARTQAAITGSQELSNEQSSIVLTDVANAYEALRTGDRVVQLYESGYLQQAADSRDISQYAYQRGSGTLLDFLDSERTYRTTQLAYRQSLADYMLALEQLREAVGTRSLP